jgi:superfamily II DNA or RNA helicase
MPLSFKGRMVQYAGRLHRLSDGKTNVLIHDYVDSGMAVTLKMYRNRIKAYKEMGYTIVEPDNLNGTKSIQSKLIVDTH